eukprot:7167437-Prymnesium_polylepis.1
MRPHATACDPMRPHATPTWCAYLVTGEKGTNSSCSWASRCARSRLGALSTSVSSASLGGSFHLAASAASVMTPGPANERGWGRER